MTSNNYKDKKIFCIILICIFILINFVMADVSDISTEDHGYVGQSEALSDDMARFFSADSPWNMLIPMDASIDDHSDEMIQNLVDHLAKVGRQTTANVRNYTVPVHVINPLADDADIVIVHERTGTSNFHPSVDENSRDPVENGIGLAQIRIQRGDEIVFGIPMPTGIWPDPKSDGHMTLITYRPVILPDFSPEPHYYSFDFSRLTFSEENSRWEASRVYVWNLDDRGYEIPFSGERWWKRGARGAGTPLLAGLVTLKEFQEALQGTPITHALAMATPTNGWNHDGSEEEQLRIPATRTDSPKDHRGSQWFLEGMRLRLKLNFEPNTDGLNKQEIRSLEILEQTLKVYGSIIVDNAEDVTFYMEGRDRTGNSAGPWEQYGNFQSLLNRFPASAFEVIAGENWTRGQQKFDNRSRQESEKNEEHHGKLSGVDQ